MIHSFSQFLTEGISAHNASKVALLIQKYLTRKVGSKFHKLPGIEHYHNSIEKGFGIRYFFNGAHSIRFNWKADKFDFNALHSVDYWNGSSHDPNFHIAFDHDTSLAKVLPTVIDFLDDPRLGELDIIPPDSLSEEAQKDLDNVIQLCYNGSTLNEMVLTEMASEAIFDGVLKHFVKGKPVDWTSIKTDFGSRGNKVALQIRDDNPGAFEKQGRTVVFTGDVKAIAKSKDAIIAKLGGGKATVTKGGSGDAYSGADASDQVDKIEKEGVEKVAYKEQLKDLSSMVKLVIKGASNALFVAGRGGTGKTHTVEKVLGELGKKDGDGYFKNTGSASAIGIYKLLYRYRNDIILFDDSDGALADQDSRNIFKAATDTKKVRKLVWNKDSKNMVHPDDMPEDEDGEDTGMIPKFFEFTGRIIFISNLQINKLDPDGALRTRAMMLAINPTDAELVEQMESIIGTIELEDGLELNKEERQKVMDEIKKSKSDVSLRKLVRGLNIRAALGEDGDWQRIVKLYA